MPPSSASEVEAVPARTRRPSAALQRWESVWLLQLASLKTTLGTTKCVLLICICDIFEAELPLRCIFSRTTFSHVRRGRTVNHMCGREEPVGYVQYLFPLCLASLSPHPLPAALLMVSAITGNSALPAKRNWWLADGLLEGGAGGAVCTETRACYCRYTLYCISLLKLRCSRMCNNQKSSWIYDCLTSYKQKQRICKQRRANII